MTDYHVPVLLHDVINGLEIKPSGHYVDVTYGGGGHSSVILQKLDNGKLYAFDQDADANRNVSDNEQLVFIPQNFRHLKKALKLYGANKVDGILADLGVSSHQFDVPERGFSFRFNGPLDMRMDKGNPVTAASIINSYNEEELYRVFREYGELRSLGRIVPAILQARAQKNISTTQELANIYDAIGIGGVKRNAELARLFQALRIEVNDEINVLKDFLTACEQVLKPDGRLVIISYHSLEDRLVKNYIKKGNIEGKAEKDFYGNLIRPFEEVNRKVIVPTDEEINNNPRARSAKLRIGRKL